MEEIGQMRPPNWWHSHHLSDHASATHLVGEDFWIRLRIGLRTQRAQDNVFGFRALISCSIDHALNHILRHRIGCRTTGQALCHFERPISTPTLPVSSRSIFLHVATALTGVGLIEARPDCCSGACSLRSTLEGDIQKRTLSTHAVLRWPKLNALKGTMIICIHKDLGFTGLQQPRQKHVEGAKLVQLRLAHSMRLQVQSSQATQPSMKQQMPQEFILCTLTIHAHHHNIIRLDVVTKDPCQVDGRHIHGRIMATAHEEKTVQAVLEDGMRGDIEPHPLSIPCPSGIGVEGPSSLLHDLLQCWRVHWIRLNQHRNVAHARVLLLSFHPSKITRCSTHSHKDVTG
mmetsp:Transcript_54392/g.119090  ORF Transcript_54392/g.119090 Transcript_54392/m.119090 type:complete len:344 (-) Transcript_54392:128-1159(-)